MCFAGNGASHCEISICAGHHPRTKLFAESLHVYTMFCGNFHVGVENSMCWACGGWVKFLGVHPVVATREQRTSPGLHPGTWTWGVMWVTSGHLVVDGHYDGAGPRFSVVI